MINAIVNALLKFIRRSGSKNKRNQKKHIHNLGADPTDWEAPNYACITCMAQTITMPVEGERQLKSPTLTFSERAELAIRKIVAETEKDVRVTAHRIAKNHFSESVSAEHVEMAYREQRPGSRKKYVLLNSIGGTLLAAGVGKTVAMCSSGAPITQDGFLLSFALAASGLCLMAVAIAKS